MQKHFESLFPADSRGREIGQIVQFIVVGDSCQLIGLPGVGKEDVFGLLAYNHGIREKFLGEKQESYHFVLTNFAEVKGKPFIEAVKLLFFSFANSLHERGREQDHAVVQGILERNLAVNQEIALVQGLKEAISYLVHEKGLHIILLLNRFESYTSDVTSEFFVLLDSLHALTEGSFASVFSLIRPLEQVLDMETYREMAPHLAAFHVYMQIHDEPSILFRLKHLEEQFGGIIRLGPKEDLLDLTGGHRKITKRAAEEMLRSGKEFKDIDTLRTFLLESRIVRSVFYELWLSLLPQEQMLLKRQVQAVGETIAAGEEEQRLIAYLQDVQLLLHNFFTISLFEDFVRYRVEHGLDEKLALNQETGDILMGEQAISGQFTSLEHRLLKLFLQNPDKVIERDELIAAVWGDVKTTEGVSDQAIDQLILRLRKKIEETPNEPKHIQTVKGRGFSYHP